MSKPDQIKVIIADDEPAARKVIKHFLTGQNRFELIDECGDGQSALVSIQEHKPDLVFLDIEMPELSGIEILAQLEEPFPIVVFITAYDQYAVKAFEENAIDYILKPFDQDRFNKSLERILKQFKDQGKHSNGLDAILNAFQQILGVSGNSKFLKKISCKHKGKINFVPVEDIIWIESEGSFCKLHLEKGLQITNLSIKRLEELLDPTTHLRIHKSHMVNIEEIETIEPYFHGEYMINLNNGVTLKLSRGYKQRLESILNQYK